MASHVSITRRITSLHRTSSYGRAPRTPPPWILHLTATWLESAVFFLQQIRFAPLLLLSVRFSRHNKRRPIARAPFNQQTAFPTSLRAVVLFVLLVLALLFFGRLRTLLLLLRRTVIRTRLWAVVRRSCLWTLVPLRLLLWLLLLRRTGIRLRLGRTVVSSRGFGAIRLRTVRVRLRRWPIVRLRLPWRGLVCPRLIGIRPSVRTCVARLRLIGLRTIVGLIRVGPSRLIRLRPVVRLRLGTIVRLSRRRTIIPRRRLGRAIRLRPIRFRLIRLRPVWLRPVRLRLVRLWAIRLGLIWLRPIGFRLIRLRTSRLIRLWLIVRLRRCRAIISRRRFRRSIGLRTIVSARLVG